MAPKKKQVSPPEIKKLQLAAVPDASVVSQRKYSTYVQVQNTNFDMTLRFCDITPIYNMQEFLTGGKKEHHIPVIAEIAIPVSIVPGLIKALQQKLDESEKIHKEELQVVGNKKA